MYITVEPSALASGKVTVPGDKSISHRALMLAAIAEGQTRIRGFLNGEDCLATLAALKDLGVTIEQLSDTELIVEGRGSAGLQPPSAPLDMGNSGTAMRLFAGLLAGQPFSSKLVGDDSLSQRPMNRVIKPLMEMGAKIDTADGWPPLEIRGGRSLSGISYRLPVASAQVKSALLLAGLYAEGEMSIIEPAITRDHTERMLRSMGAAMSAGETQLVIPGKQVLQGTEIEVPADLSSAAFIILAALVAPGCEVEITNVGVNPTRTGAIDILRDMGADIGLDNVRLFGEEPVADITVRSSELTGIEVDPARVSLAIDEFPMLFVAAACARGKTTFTGLAELRIKESDRISVMAEGLRQLGATVDETDDGAAVHGATLAGGRVRSHGDHRVAMAFAVAGTAAIGPVRIDDTDAVATSFPGFVDCLRSLGISIAEHREESAIASEVPVIAIDGPSGSGKGTIARRVARALKWHLLDSGALYRLVAVAADRKGETDASEESLAAIAAELEVRFDTDDAGDERVWLGNSDVSTELRTEECGRLASHVAALPKVREALLGVQKGFREAPGLVADGRDMGTTVFPDAVLKVFLTASPGERAKRRHKQLKDKGIDVSLPALSRDIEDRDRRDSERSVAPLRPAEDARLLDSSKLTIDEVTQTVLDWALERMNAK